MVEYKDCSTCFKKKGCHCVLHSRFNQILILGMLFLTILTGCDQPQSQQKGDLLLYAMPKASLVFKKATENKLQAQQLNLTTKEGKLLSGVLSAMGLYNGQKNFFILYNPLTDKIIPMPTLDDSVPEEQYTKLFHKIQELNDAGKSNLKRLDASSAKTVKLTVFSDFQCPFCKQLDQLLPTLLAQYPGKVDFQMLHYPLPMHPFALPAAVSAECARQQNQFDAFKTGLFQNQENLGPTTIDQVAKQLNLDSVAFKTCMGNQSGIEKVKEDYFFGQYLGVSGTPTVLIDGKMLGAMGPDQLRDKLEEALVNKKLIPKKASPSSENTVSPVETTAH
jgi:protein-disulfide isomerase